MTEQKEPERPANWGEMDPGEKSRWLDEHPIDQVEAPEDLQESSAPVGTKFEQRNQGKTGIRRLYSL